MGGSTTTESSGTSSQINQIPQWMSDAGQQNYALAQNIALQPLQQYQGQMVADVAPQTQQAWNLAANSGNVGSDQYNSATSGYLNSLAQSPYNIDAAQSGLSQANTAQSALANPTTAAQAATAQAAAAQQAALAAPTQASTANLSTLRGMNLNPYLSPYTQDVINKTLPIMNQSLQQQQNAIGNQANQANAFGGSRQAINQGVLGAQGAQSEAQMAAQLNQANYAQAQQAGMYDVGQANNMGQFNANQLNQVGMYNQGQANTVGMYNAGQGNQVNLQNALMANAANQYNAGQSNQVGMYNQGQANNMGQFNANQANQMGQFNTGQANQMGQFNASALNTAAAQNQAAQQAKINSDILASQGLTNTGSAMNAANAANYGLLSSAGAQQQMQAQNQINAQIAKFAQAFNYPQAQLGVLEGSLGMTPHDTSQFGQTQNQSQTTQSPDLMNIAQGGAQMASNLFPLLPTSDKTLKTDITELGKDPKTGLKMSAFRYKGDPKSYPKVVGPMAQDVEEKYPGKTVRQGGKLTVSPDIMSAAGVKGYAAGTPFVPPSIGAFTPPSSPGVAKGISALGAFRPPVRMSRGYGVPHMQRFAFGTPKVPGQGMGDTVPAMLTPGEAVLTGPAAQRVGRGRIAALNAGRPWARSPTEARRKLRGFSVPDQRPQYQHGVGTIDGTRFNWGSGMPGKYWSIPYGDYPVTPNAPTGAWAHQAGAIPVSNNVIPDPLLGRNRIGIMIHSGSAASLDQLYTQGCFKVDPQNWPAVRSEILSDAQKGPLYLHVQPGGVASFTNTKTMEQTSLPTAANPSAAPATASAYVNSQPSPASPAVSAINKAAPLVGQQSQLVGNYASQIGAANPFYGALTQIESGGRNIPSEVDKDYPGMPGSKSQGYAQIDVPTWRQFAPKAGVDINRYPTPMSAPPAVQQQGAYQIPMGRFGGSTLTKLGQQFGAIDKTQTVGQYAQRFAQNAQNQQQQQDASAAPTGGPPASSNMFPAGYPGGNPPTAPTAPQNIGDWIKKGLTKPPPTKDAQGNPVQEKSPIEKALSAFQPPQQQQAAAAPDTSQPQLGPIQDPTAQMMGPSQQLLTAAIAAGAKPLSWSARPFGYQAGQQMGDLNG